MGVPVVSEGKAVESRSGDTKVEYGTDHKTEHREKQTNVIQGKQLFCFSYEGEIR